MGIFKFLADGNPWGVLFGRTLPLAFRSLFQLYQSCPLKSSFSDCPAGYQRVSFLSSFLNSSKIFFKDLFLLLWMSRCIQVPVGAQRGLLSPRNWNYRPLWVTWCGPKRGLVIWGYCEALRDMTKTAWWQRHKSVSPVFGRSLPTLHVISRKLSSRYFWSLDPTLNKKGVKSSSDFPSLAFRIFFSTWNFQLLLSNFIFHPTNRALHLFNVLSVRVVELLLNATFTTLNLMLSSLVLNLYHGVEIAFWISRFVCVCDVTRYLRKLT